MYINLLYLCRNRGLKWVGIWKKNPQESEPGRSKLSDGLRVKLIKS